MFYLLLGNNCFGCLQFGGLNVSVVFFLDWIVYVYGLGFCSVQGYCLLLCNVFWQQDGVLFVIENWESECDIEWVIFNGKFSMVYDFKEDYYLFQEFDLQVGMVEDVFILFL